jgi:hypothetical protein
VAMLEATRSQDGLFAAAHVASAAGKTAGLPAAKDQR